MFNQQEGLETPSVDGRGASRVGIRDNPGERNRDSVRIASETAKAQIASACIRRAREEGDEDQEEREGGIIIHNNKSIGRAGQNDYRVEGGQGRRGRGTENATALTCLTESFIGRAAASPLGRACRAGFHDHAPGRTASCLALSYISLLLLLLLPRKPLAEA